ncbi:MAG TPA: diguanylate cyclase [Phycisphaerae bacterium]|nr:diguanylate cyclase [Phycisphaerae bacterium]
MRPETLHPATVLYMSGDPTEVPDRLRQLAAAGWHTMQVAESIEALATAKAERLDLALLHLPVDAMVSTDFPNVLRGVATASYLPVIILADSPAEQQRCRFLDSGADDVVCTSTGPEELNARIRAMLRVKLLHDQLAASRGALQEALRRERKLLGKLRRDNAHLQALVTTDPLTHVQNRRSFREILDHEFKIARRYNQPLSLLALDVDHFKVVNDAHGHPSGDYVLKELAVILTRSVRESDVVARTGGEEFCVLLPKAARGQAAQFAERIRTEVYRRQFIVFGQTIHITTSIGSATYPVDAEITEPDMLAYFADQALLVAKETGRDRVVAFHELGPAVRRRLRHQYEAMPTASEELSPCHAILETITTGDG